MTQRPLFVEPAAEAEADAVAAYLEGEREGLSTRFLNDLAVAFDRVLATPEAFAPVQYEPRARSARVGRFKDRVFFIVESNRLRVVAIAHAGREPGYWRARIQP